MTTLARLGLILEGEVVPCNWIERAFASIVSTIKTILPTFAYTDIGKSLQVVDSGETKPATVALIQRQKPTQATSTRFTLAEGTYDWSGLEVGDTVKITVNGAEKSCEVAESSSTLYCNYPYGESSSFKFMSNGNVQAVSQPDLDISTVYVSGTKIGEVPIPELGWDSVREVPAVGNADKGKYLHANSGTGALEWNAVNEVPAVETEDKGKYLKANDSTGALEWATAGGGGGGVLYVNDTYDDATNSSTLDKNYTEIITAMQTQLVVIREDLGGGSYDYYYIINTASALGYSVSAVQFVEGAVYERVYESNSATGVLTYQMS